MNQRTRESRRIGRAVRPVIAVVLLATAGLPTRVAAAEAPRQVTLETSASQVTYGETVTVSGVVSAPQGTPGACVVGTTVVIRGMGPTDVVPIPPPQQWGEVGRVTTDASGAYSFTFSPRGNASYAAHLPRQETPSCDEAVSGSRSIGVRVRVELEVQDRRVDRGSRAQLTVRVFPYCSSFSEADVRLERLIAGEFEEVAEGESAEAEPCLVRFRPRIQSAGTYRAVSGPNCSIVCQHERGTSRTIRIRISRS